MKLDDPNLKQAPFTVPNRYFDGLNSSIMRQVEQPKANAELAWWQLPQVKFSVALAAALFLLAGSGWWWQAGGRQVEESEVQAIALLDQVSASDIETYLLSTDLSAVEVAELLQEENLPLEFTDESTSVEDQLLELDLELSDFEEVL